MPITLKMDQLADEARALEHAAADERLGPQAEGFLFQAALRKAVVDLAQENQALKRELSLAKSKLPSDRNQLNRAFDDAISTIQEAGAAAAARRPALAAEAFEDAISGPAVDADGG